MERYCTLCGGKLANGICTECGLDNTKDDKKYNLNTHNDKTLKFHDDDCEDHLNRKSSGKASGTKASGASGARNSATAANAGRTGTASAGSNHGGVNSTAAGTVKTGTARKKQLSERGQTGTVKKKKRHWLLWIFILFYVFGMFGESGLLSRIWWELRWALWDLTHGF